MGNDAEIFIFDYSKYKKDCVPEFLNLLLGKENSNWFIELLTDFDYEYYENIKNRAKDYPTDILKHCEILSDDLSYKGYFYKDKIFNEAFTYYNQSKIYSSETKICKSNTCPEAVKNCIFHKNQNVNGQFPMEDFNCVYNEIVGNYCLKYFQFLGRSATPFDFEKCLSKILIKDNSINEIRDLLYLLGSRGNVAGAKWFDNDGIHGWLNYEETKKLINLIKILPLPEYEATLENVKKFDYANEYINFQSDKKYLANNTKEEKFKNTPEKWILDIFENFDWHEITLSLLRSMGEISIKEEKGILWANNLAFKNYLSIKK